MTDVAGVRASARPPASLPGWGDDDASEARRAWSAMTRDGRPPPDFAAFDAHPVGAVHVTGYYEPELPGARTRSAAFPVPIHTLPPMGIGASRAEIEAHDLLAGHEIAFLRDPVDRFFLQVQGSGRIVMEDGSVLRVTYAGRNGHPYRSLGRILIERGEIAEDAMSAGAVQGWLRADPERGMRLMHENPSYVMFRALHGSRAEEGPPGTMGVPLTPGRSVAMDVDVAPLGTAVWLEIDGPDPIRRLCIVQDTGSAIKGARVDLFIGTGAVAGRIAGEMNRAGRATLLLPR